MHVTRTPEGAAYLHLWRDGGEYVRQKREILREWTNVRYVAIPKRPEPGFYYVDLSRERLEFPDETFDAAYSYHVLEHLTPEEGERLVAEVHRVLKPDGTFRVSVPDLELACRDYLDSLERVTEDPNLSNMRRYRWSVMEIFDQMVREKSGGGMVEAIAAGDYDPEYIEERYSDVFRPILERHAEGSAGKAREKRVRTSLLSAPGAFVRRLKKARHDRKYGDPRHPAVSKERVRWMYDRVSLRLILEDAGFVGFERVGYRESGIPNWERYDLDASDVTGRPIDPSIYVEARKPAR